MTMAKISELPWLNGQNWSTLTIDHGIFQGVMFMVSALPPPPPELDNEINIYEKVWREPKNTIMTIIVQNYTPFCHNFITLFDQFMSCEMEHADWTVVIM